MVVSLSLNQDVEIDVTDVQLRDSRGRDYEIVSVAGADRSLTIVADDSPRWWGVKYFELALQDSQPVRIPMTDVIERQLKSFPD